MLAPAILPLQLTLACLAALTLLALIFVPWLRKHPGQTARFCLLGWMICFIPVAYVVGSAVDAVRYGEFHYPSTDQIHDHHVRLPPEAREIVLFKFASGHDVKFVIDEADLRRWYAEFQVSSDSNRMPGQEKDESGFESRFEKHKRNWRCPDDALFLPGPRARNGAGFDLWYSPRERVAFLGASYW